MVSINFRPSAPRRSLAERVIQLVARHADIDPLELPPLYHTIDPEAVDAIIRSIDNGRVCFWYEGYLVSIDSRRTIRIADPPTASEAPTDIATEWLIDAQRTATKITGL